MEEDEMSNVLHPSVVGKFIYVVVYIQQNLAHAMSVVSNFMSKLGKEYWNFVN